MRRLALLLLVLFALLAHSQVSDANFLNAKVSGLRRFDQVMAGTLRAVDLGEKLASERGIQVARIQLTNLNGQAYPALQILPMGESSQNIEAKRVYEKMSGLPLIFSPYDLSFGSQAYFMPDGSHLGVPYEFFTDGPVDSSYRHELLHANTQNLLVDGSNPQWGGFMKAARYVNERAYVSSKNSEGYASLAALDEIVATALSVKLETAAVMKLKETLPKKEFEKVWGLALPRVSSVHFSLESGIGLAKQTADLAVRALADLSNAQIERTTLTIGQKTSEIYQTVFKLESFYRDSSYKLQSVKRGTTFVLYSYDEPNMDSLKSRLTEIQRKSAQAQADFETAIKTISKGIAHVEPEKTDFEALAKLANLPFDHLSQ